MILCKIFIIKDRKNKRVKVKIMKILIACEFSGIVRDAFTRMGHIAVSCDLLPSESPGLHFQGDVLSILDNDWDMMIAHPPCTYLSYAANHCWNKPGRKELREDAMKFFMKLYNAPIPKIAIENPVGYPNTIFRKPDQIVRPYYFGEPIQKNICLWLKNLKPLLYDKDNAIKPKPIYTTKTGPKTGKAIHFAEANHGSHARSKFFVSVADAMANQWTLPLNIQTGKIY
jgi:hypothetical protein